MTRHIFLDSHPLGALSHPQPEIAILRWLTDCRLAGHIVCVPEVIDYEIRRELLRAGKFVGIRNLDALKATLRFVPITSKAMLLAADLWASSRQSGLPTGDPKKLDIDVILAAQALTLGLPTNEIIVATSNVSHISRFVPAELWNNITV